VGSAVKYTGSPTRIVLANLVINVREPALNGFERDTGYVGESSIGQTLSADPVPEHFVRNHRPITARIAVMILRRPLPVLAACDPGQPSLAPGNRSSRTSMFTRCRAGRSFVSEMSGATSKMSVDVHSDVRFVPLN